MGASRQDDIPRANLFLSAVRQRHRELPRHCQFALSVDDFDVVLFHQEADSFGQPLAHLPAAFVGGRIIELEVLKADAEFLRARAHQVSQLRIAQQRLGGNAANIQTDSAQIFLLDDAHFPAELRCSDRSDVSSGSCS